MKTITSSPNLALEPLLAPEAETAAISELQNAIPEDNQIKLIGKNGEEITLPESVDFVFRHVLNLMASGKAVSVISYDQELSTQQAADLLNVSRPYLIKLLKQGEIPHIMVGTHRRVRFGDVMKYKKQRDSERREGLKQLTQFLQAEGFYD
jgi:excisionase family DNA binding protein